MQPRDDLPTLLRSASQLRDAGRVAEAMEMYERILAQWPDLPDSWYNLAWLQRNAGRFQASIDSYGQALARGVRDPEEVHVNRAVIFSDFLARPELARRELTLALSTKPDFIPALLNLANLHEDLAEREEAARAYEHVLSVDPENALALARMPNVRVVRDTADPLIARLRRAIARPRIAEQSLADLGFGLGKALDDAAAYDEAFEAYAAANQASRRIALAQGVRYEAAACERWVDRVIAASGEPPRTGPGQQPTGPQPIFICGMFRSGSTLVEQILAGHREVTAGGELELLPALVREVLGPQVTAPSGVDEDKLRLIRHRYLEGLAARFPAARFVTDKRPDNFLHLGLIRRLFPAARIVHTRRHPLDNCLSIYFLHVGPSAPYASDLNDAAHWYRQYHRLMRHWTSLHAQSIHDVLYDELIREPERVVEKLLDHCGLGRDPSCLEFGRSGAPVRTASVWQVRQPLYTSSSGRWRNYERHLGALVAALGDLAGEK
jgi:tetratricopeptide (TPR) repeat protein